MKKITTKSDLADIHILKRKAIWLIYRIWSRRKWSFEWLMKTIPLKYQEQFFTQYRKLYENDKERGYMNFILIYFQ